MLISGPEHRVLWDDADPKLTISQFKVVNLLTAPPGRWRTYREIYDCFKPRPGMCAGQGEHGYRTNVRGLMKLVRQKFALIDPGFDMIGTYMGLGYRWEDR